MAADRQLSEYEAKRKERAHALDSTRKAVGWREKAIGQVEDEVFADFCKKHGFDNIRTYEAQQGSLEQEAAEKRSEFQVQESRLESSLRWATSTYEHTVKRVKQIQDELGRLEKDLEAYQEQKRRIEEAMGRDGDELEALKESLEDIKTEHAAKVDAVADAKAQLQQRMRKVESREKDINALQTEVQKNSASKFSVLRRCRLEQIQIPLVHGSLDELPNEDKMLNQDPDAMDVDGGDEEIMEAAMDDYGIEVDFDGLEEDLKNVRTGNIPPPEPACTCV